MDSGDNFHICENNKVVCLLYNVFKMCRVLRSKEKIKRTSAFSTKSMYSECKTIISTKVFKPFNKSPTFKFISNFNFIFY